LPHWVDAPYTFTLRLRSKTYSDDGSFLPGGHRTAEWEFIQTNSDVMQVMSAFNVIQR
jgi:hypothetical protein